jgi:type I restriction enzyme S subunit
MIPLPPRPEQERVVEASERLLSFRDETAQQLSHGRHRVLRLRQSILKWAFEGKLVDQDPNDEPAEKLLAYIRAERAALGSDQRTRRRNTTPTP